MKTAEENQAFHHWDLAIKRRMVKSAATAATGITARAGMFR